MRDQVINLKFRRITPIRYGNITSHMVHYDFHTIKEISEKYVNVLPFFGKVVLNVIPDIVVKNSYQQFFFQTYLAADDIKGAVKRRVPLFVFNINDLSPIQVLNIRKTDIGIV